MKKGAIIGLLTTILVLVTGFIGCSEWFCRISVKCSQCPLKSPDINTSKTKGYFIGTYLPIKSDIALRYHNESIHFDSAWAEEQWLPDNKICLLKKTKRGKGYTLILPFKASKTEFNFEIYQLKNGIPDTLNSGIMSNRKEFFLKEDKINDTLNFIISEKDSAQNIGWRNGDMYTDTLTYIRQSK